MRTMQVECVNTSVFRVFLAIVVCAFGVRALDINVRNAPYNAAGDGTTNDRVAIQDAIDDVSAAGGGMVTIPDGYTFLTGEIQVKSNVTLQIDGDLRKSNTQSHFAHATTYGRMVPGSPNNWDMWAYRNYPFLYTTSGAADVTVQGNGRLDLNYSGDDNSTIHVHSIGFFDTDNFTIRDVTIDNSMAYNIFLVRCRGGEVTNVKTTNPAPNYNNDGISLNNCQNMRIHSNNLVCGDDNIYIWSSYRDPRLYVWCNSDNPQPSINIEIDHNTLKQIVNGSNFCIFPWSDDAPDQSMVRIDNLNIHDNTLLPGTNWSWGTKFRYQEWDVKSTNGHCPISNVRINNNGIGSRTMHDGSESQFPCSGFETNDITDPWFTNAIGGVSSTVQTPTFTPAGGRFTSPQSVVISCATSGATIRYTTDGSSPTASSTTYSDPIPVSTTTTIKARAIKNGMDDSDIGSSAYQIVAPGSAVTLFTNEAPANPDLTDNTSYELGTKFTSSEAGRITAIRYYRASSETGSHTGHIWSSTGALLASVAFTGETSSGWQEAALSTPLPLPANTAYVVSVNCNSHYVATTSALATSIVNAPLSTVADGANGVYGAAGAYPTQSFGNSNYFRDVVFMQSTTAETTPRTLRASPAGLRHTKWYDLRGRHILQPTGAGTRNAPHTHGVSLGVARGRITKSIVPVK